jgi:transcription antitermination factor NusG
MQSKRPRPVTVEPAVVPGAPERRGTAPTLLEDERWYVAQTLARRELGAAFQLERQGFRVFLPQMIKTVRHARTFRTTRAAVFPGYLFVALALGRDRWRSVNGTFGVSRLIMGESLPLPAPHGVVETLLAFRDSDGLCRFDRELKPGDAVRVVKGPLAHVVGTIASLDDKGRARVLLDLMGTQLVTSIAMATLERAE